MSEEIKVDDTSNAGNKSIALENGTLNALGVDIKISDIIGEKMVNQWMAQISEEDMQLIFDCIEREIFSHNYNDEKYFVTQMQSKDRWGNNTNVDTPIWAYTQQLFAKKFNEKILARVDDILNSPEFEKRADDIATQIVDYATEGYKEDMVARIRERMILNVTGPMPYYDGEDLRSIIHHEISNIIHR